MKNEDQRTKKVADLENDSQKVSQLLLEVATHLTSCLQALKSSEDSVINCDSILVPNSIHPDNLRQMMRKVEDDVIAQMALLSNLKNSLGESVGTSDDAQVLFF